MNLNPELWLVLIPALSWLCFALGGTQISDTVGGKKWIRRFILPFIYGICLFLAHYALWQALSVATIGCAMFHLGYGSKANWGARIAIFAGYGLISAPIGISWWNLITFGGCAVMFLLSNIKLTSAIMVWKVVEGVFGALIGVQIAYLMAGNGLVWLK